MRGRASLSTKHTQHTIACAQYREYPNVQMYKRASDVKKCGAGQKQSFKKSELRALANQLFYFGYGIAERLPIAASPGGRSRIRAEGSEQEAD